jgi:energy-coupling factor transporter ATP-binding protein EcfA2
MFQKATKRQSRARVALIGPSGSGKTYTALQLATDLAGENGRVALIDTERGSASKYADEFDFDVCELDGFDPRAYVKAIKAAEDAGYTVLVIDSLSHAWAGTGGALELVDKVKARSQNSNSFTAWRDVTPLHNRLVDAIVQSRCHVIATMRAKTEYVMETDHRGKQVPRKIGLAPVQRDGVEYEFDVVADLDLDHNLIVSKTRCRALDKAVVPLAEGVGDTLRGWLADGSPVDSVGGNQPTDASPATGASYTPTEPTETEQLQKRVKALRQAERDYIAEPSAFTTKQAQDIGALQAEIVASRTRLRAAYQGLTRHEIADTTDDTNLIVAVRKAVAAQREAAA